MKEPLLGKNLEELSVITKQWNAPDLVAWNIARWMYRRGISDFNKMDDISFDLRHSLSKTFIPGSFPYKNKLISQDGSIKYTFINKDQQQFESVYLPEGRRHTLCLSVQSGCRMGCRFCRTGHYGFNGNLEVHEIINQLFSVDERKVINHLVFMGMGEPMDNYTNLIKSIDIFNATWGFAIAYRSITVSTVGINPGMHHFLHHNRCNLALSLHSPFEEERQQLIPAEKVYPFRKLLAEMKSYKPEKKRRITIQYTLIGGLNDSKKHLQELIHLLKGTHLKLNLIPFHPFRGCEYQSPDQAVMQEFIKSLNAAGIFATLRKSRGLDIGAACGLLAAAKPG